MTSWSPATTPRLRRETWLCRLGSERQVETRGRPGDQAVDAEPGRSGPKVQSLQEDDLSRRPKRNAAIGRPMKRPRRNRLAGSGHAPARPREARRRIEQVIAFIACLVDHSSRLVPGERPVVLCLSPTAKQSGVVLGYVVGIIESSPTLTRLIVGKTAESISLSNGIDIEVRPASFRGVRGVTTIAVVADEAAFWYTEDSASTNPDSAILDAVRPSLATTGGMLAVISSPYGKRGAVYEAFDRHFGAKGDKLVLVAKGASRDFNPSLPQKIVDRAYEKDPIAASAEYGGEFRSDLERFISLEAVQACVMPGVLEIAPQRGRTFTFFCDPSGGSSDSMTLAGAYRDYEGGAILACLRERRPPFSPAAVVAEFVQVLRQYGCTEVIGDAYGAQMGPGIVSAARNPLSPVRKEPVDNLQRTFAGDQFERGQPSRR
jgi:hypothetical protein